MALTAEQLATLAADIVANSGAGGDFEGIPNTPDGHFAIRDAYNAAAVPAFRVWRTAVPTKEIKDSAIDWVAFKSNSMSNNDYETWRYMVSNGVLDLSSANVRAGIVEIFDTPAKQPIATALFALGERDATRAEKLFADTSGGNGAPGTPATATFEGNLSLQDVAAARS